MPHASDRENESGPFAGNEAFPVLEGQRTAERPIIDILQANMKPEIYCRSTILQPVTLIGAL